MKITTLSALATTVLIAVPAYAAREFDCPTTQEVQSQPEGTMMSEDLVQKRRQSREADLARLRERFTRAASAQSVAVSGSPARASGR